MRRVGFRAGLVIVSTAILAGGAGCDQKGTNAQKTVTQAVQQASPAARRGAWHGTVTVRTTASGDFPDPSNNEFSETTHSVGFTQSANFSVDGDARAKVSYTENTNTRFRYDYDSNTLSGTQDMLISASGQSTEARVNIEIYEGGPYVIDYFARGVPGEHTITGVTQLRCKPGVDPECRDRNDTTDEKAPVMDLGHVSGGVEGRIDRKDPNRLSGTYTEDYEHGNEVLGRTVVNWELSR